MGSTFKPALLLMMGRVVAFTVTFFIPVVLVRIFDQAEFGTYKQAFLVYAGVFIIAQLGMAESLFYFLPQAPEKAGRFVANSMLVLAGVGAACLGGLWALAPRFTAWFRNAALAENVPLIGLMLFFGLAAAMLEVVMISRKRYLAASLSYGLSDFVRALLFIIPGLVARDLRWLFLGGVAFSALRLCTALFYASREFGTELRPDRHLLRRQLAYALPFAGAVLVEIVQGQYHYFAVSWHFDAATFAIYAVGCLQIPLVDFVAGPACNVMMVRMSEEIRERRAEVVLAIWHDTTRKLALIFFPVFVLLFVTAPKLIEFLFTSQYAASVPIFLVWSLTVIFSVVQTDSVLRVYAKTRFLFLLYSIRLAMIVTLFGFFVKAMWLQGAVLLTVLAIVVAKSLALWRLTGLLGVGFRRILPWSSLGAILVVSLAAGVPAALVVRHLTAPLLGLLFVAGFMYMAFYLFMLFRFGLLSEGERVAIAGLLQRPPESAGEVIRG